MIGQLKVDLWSPTGRLLGARTATMIRSNLKINLVGMNPTSPDIDEGFGIKNSSFYTILVHSMGVGWGGGSPIHIVLLSCFTMKPCSVLVSRTQAFILY